MMPKTDHVQDALEILIVEDSATQAERLRNLLEQHHYKVLVANNGRKALTLLANHKPSLVITDVVMPEMNGYELCQQIKEADGELDIPVILLTSLSNAEDVLEGLACGADNFITKPYSDDFLILHVQQILANRRLHKHERVRVGVEIMFGGKRRFVTADQQQMLTLLISTYEAAVTKNDELLQTQNELRVLNEQLEEKVEKRTASLAEEVAVRRQAEEQVRKLVRVHSVLSNVNQTIVREHHPERLFKDICRIAVEDGQFQSVSIGMVKAGTKALDIVEAAGASNEYRVGTQIDLTDQEESQTPASIALQTREHVIWNDLLHPPKNGARGKERAQLKSGSLAALPITILGEASGVILLTSDETGFFDEDEVGLLDEMAMDVSFALEFIQKESKRALAEAEARNLAKFPSENPSPVLRVNQDGTILFANKASGPLLKDWGVAVNDCVPPYWKAIVADVLSDMSPKIVELVVHDRAFSLIAAPIPEAGYVNLYGLDITDRKRAEEELEKRNAFVETLLENAPIGFAVNTVDDGRSVFINHKFEEIYGVTQGSILSVEDYFEKVYLDPAFREEIRERVLADLASGEADRMRWDNIPITTMDGERKFITAVNIPLLEQNLMISTVQDVTGRMRASEALKKSEEKYRGIFENVQDLYYESAIDGTILEVSPSIEILSGGQYHREDLIGKSMYDFYPDAAERQALLEALQTRGRVTDFEINLKNRDGSRVPCSVSAIIHRDHEGRPDKIIGSMRDITERKQMEQAVLYEQGLLRAMMDNLPDHVYFKDRESRFLRISLSQAHEFDLDSPVLAVGKSDFDFFGEEHARRAFEMEQEIMKSGRAVEDLEEKETWADGRVTWVSTTKVPLRDPDGNIIGTFGISRDITERKKAEESRLLLTTALESTATGVAITDLEGRIVWVNKAFTDMTGYTWEEVIGRNPKILKSGTQDPKFYEDLWKTVTAGKVWTGDLINKRKDGSLYIEEMTITPVRNEEQKVTHFVALKQDISERKRVESNLRQSEERFHLVWDKSADGMRLIDREGRIVAVNEAYCSIVGKPREELVGELFSVVYQRGGPDDEIRLYRERYKSRALEARLQSAVTMWNGRVVELDISNSFIEAEGAERMVLSMFRDITDRKLAAKRLEEERNLLRTLIDAIPDEIAVKDLQRRFLVVNTGTIKAFGKVRPEEFIGKRDEDFMSRDLALLSRKEEDALLVAGGAQINRIGSKTDENSGEIQRSLLVTKVPLKDISGKTIGLVGINRDITEIKRSQSMLEKERTSLLALIESIPDEICLKDRTHRFIVANAAVAKALGAGSADELLGKTDQDFMDPETAFVHVTEEDAIMASGEPMISRERTRRDQVTGEIEKCLLTTKVPVKDKNGIAIGILVINRYITDRKKAEESLRASEEKFRALFEESMDVVYISTPEGKLQDINGAGLVLFGYTSKEELLRVDLSTIYVDSQKRAEFKRRMDDQGYVRDIEQQLRQRGGEILTVLETATAVREKSGKVVLYRGMIRDVTKQRLLERQFIQAQKMESIGTLAGGIAHDFNNILGIVLGHLALLERTRENEAQFEESILSINKAVERGASLVRQILIFARKTDVQLEPVSVNSTVRELAKMLEETFPKTMTITTHLDKTIPVISMDPTQLHQTLLNLCVNARDAMQETGTLNITSRLVAGTELSSRFPKASASHYVELSVADTGTGMDENTRARIFEPFFTTKEKGKGTGLGLAVVYGVLQAHNGYVDLESQQGAGTTFHLFFPVPEGILAKPKKGGESKEDLPGGTETILVVEDEDVLRDIVVKLLEMHGYKVIQATDGEEAVVRFGEHVHEIDLVLSDMGLPKRGGWEAFKMMRQMAPKVRCLLASGYIEPGQKSEALKSGVRGFIQKPYKVEDILSAVRKTLDAKKK